MISPVHCESRASKASGSKCTNAVERMTPVPKCLPRKNTIDGTRTYLIRFESDGKETAGLW